MAEELPGLLFPPAVGRMDREFPRRDQPPPRQRRQPSRRPPDGHDAAPARNPDPDESAVGTHLNVRA